MVRGAKKCMCTIDGKENEKIHSFFKDKTCWHLKLNDVLQVFLVRVKHGTIKAICAQFIPIIFH